MPAIARVGCVWLLVVATAHAVVPLDLPRPDATPGNPAKPVYLVSKLMGRWPSKAKVEVLMVAQH